MTGSRISQTPPAKYLNLTKKNGGEGLAGGGGGPEVPLPSHVPPRNPLKRREGGFFLWGFSPPRRFPPDSPPRRSYPDATPEELQAMDNVCIICREEMVTGAKRLPCNHIFHTRWVRSRGGPRSPCPVPRPDFGLSGVFDVLGEAAVKSRPRSAGGVGAGGVLGRSLSSAVTPPCG